MYKVMIVDDESTVRGRLEKNLKNSSLDIEVAASVGDGKAALEAARKVKPDIVITDISMPFMDGLELIQALQKEGIQTKNVLVSAYDEFDYAKTAISLGVKDYLLKPFMPDELRAVLEKIIQELNNNKALNKNLQMLKKLEIHYRSREREQILRKIIKAETISEEEMRKLPVDLSETGSYGAVCLLNFKNASWDFAQQEQAEEFVELIATGYFMENLKICGLSLESDKMVIFFLGSPESAMAFRNQILDGLKRISHSLLSYYNIIIYCNLGRIYSSVKGLSDSYQEAVETWRGAINPEKNIRIYGENKENPQLGNLEMSSKINTEKTNICMCICAGKLDEALEHLSRLMRLYASISNKGAEYRIISAGELIYDIGDDMEKNGFEREESDISKNLKDKISSGSLLELREILETYIRNCCDKVNADAGRSNAEAAVLFVKNYVEKNLGDQNLSVQSAAENVHFSVSYLRQIFKELTGESFNEFLIRKRMEKAGEYLQNTSMKIQEIAEQCGYESQRYFASSFKKFYGCTPTHFKEQISKN